jgi:hypothetical protein
MDRAEALRDQAIERLADQLARRVAERRLGGRVEERDLLVGVDDDDSIGGGRDHAAEPRLRLRGPIPHQFGSPAGPVLGFGQDDDEHGDAGEERGADEIVAVVHPKPSHRREERERAHRRQDGGDEARPEAAEPRRRRHGREDVMYGSFEPQIGFSS